MIIAISSTGTTLADAMDTRFGRAKYFLFFNTETKEVTAVENKQNLQAAQGAGIQSAVRVAENGAQALLTGHCGPKAFRVLREAEVKIFLTGAATGEEALKLYSEGALTEAENADVEGHWV